MGQVSGAVPSSRTAAHPSTVHRGCWVACTFKRQRDKLASYKPWWQRWLAGEPWTRSGNSDFSFLIQKLKWQNSTSQLDEMTWKTGAHLATTNSLSLPQMGPVFTCKVDMVPRSLPAQIFCERPLYMEGAGNGLLILIDWWLTLFTQIGFQALCEFQLPAWP